MPKINFSQTLKTIDGVTALKDGTSLGDKTDPAMVPDFTLRTASVQALLNPNKFEENRLDGRVAPNGKEKEERFKLAQRIAMAETELQVSSEEIVLIKQLIADGYGVLVVGQANQMLEA